MARGGRPRSTRFTERPPTRQRTKKQASSRPKPRPKPKIIKTLPSRPKLRPKVTQSQNAIRLKKAIARSKIIKKSKARAGARGRTRGKTPLVTTKGGRILSQDTRPRPRSLTDSAGFFGFNPQTPNVSRKSLLVAGAGIGKVISSRKVTVASPSGSGKTLTVSTRSRLARGRKKKVIPKGLRSKPRPERKQPPPAKRFGSDFDIFRVSTVGRGQDQRSVTTKTTSRTDRAGVKKRSGVPQTIKFVSEFKKPRATARTSEQRGQRIGSSRSPLNTRSSELQREFGQVPDSSPFVEGLFEIPLFVPRQAGKAIGKTVEFVSERISKKPLPKEDRAFGSDFDILNFFG